MISEDLKKNFSEIRELHNVHLWSITPDMLVFSAHVQIESSKVQVKQEDVISKINDYLLQKYNIIECTIQICTKTGLRSVTSRIDIFYFLPRTYSFLIPSQQFLSQHCFHRNSSVIKTRMQY